MNEATLDSLLILGIDQMQELDFKASNTTLNSLKDHSEDIGNKNYQILSLINLGNLYLRFNKDKEAIRYFLSAEDLSKRLNSDRYLNSIYNNIGIIYSSNNAHEKALQYFQDALSISKEQENDHRTAMNFNNIGNLQHEIDRDDEALLSFEQAIKYSEKTNDSLNLSHAYNNIGNVFFKKGEYGEAKLKFKKAISLTSSEDPFYTSQYRMNLGKTYLKLSINDSSHIYLNKAAQGFKEMNDIEHIIDVNNWLHKSSSERGYPYKAMEYLKRNVRWKDSLIQKKNSQWISEFQMNYEYGKKVKEVELLKKEARLQGLLWIGGIVFLLIVASLIVYLFRTRNQNLKQKNIILKQEKEMDELEIERNRERQSRLEQRMENNKRINVIEKERLRQKIEYRDRILASKALHLAQVNETITSLSEVLSQLSSYNEESISKLYSQAKSILRNAETTQQEWDSFFKHFEEVHPHFFSGLSKDYKNLSSNDLKLSAYYVIGLSTKEIAQILNISPASVRKRKQRLREKLSLDTGKSILDLLINYKKSSDFSEE